MEDNNKTSYICTIEEPFNIPIPIQVLGVCGFLGIIIGIICGLFVSDAATYWYFILGSGIACVAFYNIAVDVHHISYCKEIELERNKQYREIMIRHIVTIENNTRKTEEVTYTDDEQ